MSKDNDLETKEDKKLKVKLNSRYNPLFELRYVFQKVTYQVQAQFYVGDISSNYTFPSTITKEYLFNAIQAEYKAIAKEQKKEGHSNIATRIDIEFLCSISIALTIS